MIYNNGINGEDAESRTATKWSRKTRKRSHCYCGLMTIDFHWKCDGETDEQIVMLHLAAGVNPRLIRLNIPSLKVAAVTPSLPQRWRRAPAA